MSNKKQLERFNLQFVKDTMKSWSDSAAIYEHESFKSYSRLRSYLTLYQYRLSDHEKHDIRELLSQSLDEIDKTNLIDDMDSYLDGFCFKFDKSVISTDLLLPKRIKLEPTDELKIEPVHEIEDNKPIEQKDVTNKSYEQPSDYYCDNATDSNDLDYYTLQFLQ
jgi:hypothetical protein